MERYKLGDLVWAKMKGFSPWPGRVSNPINDMKNPSKPDMYCIFFFGTNNYAWINKTNIKPYFDHKDKLMKSNKSNAFKKAVEAIENYIKYCNDVAVNTKIEPRKKENILITPLVSVMYTADTKEEVIPVPRETEDISVKLESKEPLLGENVDVSPCLVPSIDKKEINEELTAVEDHYDDVNTKNGSVQEEKVELIDHLVPNIKTQETRKELVIKLVPIKIENHKDDVNTKNRSVQDEKVELIDPLVLNIKTQETRKELVIKLVPIKTENHESENSKCSSDYKDLDMQHGRTSELLKLYTNNEFECETAGSCKVGVDLGSNDKSLLAKEYTLLQNIKNEPNDFEHSEYACEDTKWNVDRLNHAAKKSLCDKNLLVSSSLVAQSEKINDNIKIEGLITDYDNPLRFNSVNKEPSSKRLKNKRKYKCLDCNKWLTEKRHLRDHYNAHRGIKKYSCAECDKRYINKNTLRCHLRAHQGIKNYECRLCHRKFAQPEGLKLHMFSHTGVRNWHCAECDKKFYNRKSLRCHLHIHQSVKNYECPLCHKKFAKYGHLKCHMNFHPGARNWSCAECGKHFTQQRNLRSHLQHVHAGIKDYECKYCQRRFCYKSEIKKHMIIHTGIKNYQCSDCFKRFFSKVAVKSHLERMHNRNSIIKKYECDLCGRKFTFLCDLKCHIKTHENITKWYKCNICQKLFSRNDSLKLHLKIHAGIKDYICNHCGKSFSQKSNLRTHLVVHDKVRDRTYECFHCKKGFFGKEHLKCHLNVHIKKGFKCKDCGKILSSIGSLKSHFHTQHSGIKSYSCHHCGKMFGESSYLKSPLKVHGKKTRVYECDLCEKKLSHITKSYK